VWHVAIDRVGQPTDAELTELKSFWMWEPFQDKWDYIRDWEEHKREAMRKSSSTHRRCVRAWSKRRRSSVQRRDGFSETRCSDTPGIGQAAGWRFVAPEGLALLLPVIIRNFNWCPPTGVSNGRAADRESE